MKLSPLISQFIHFVLTTRGKPERPHILSILLLIEQQLCKNLYKSTRKSPSKEANIATFQNVITTVNIFWTYLKHYTAEFL